VSEGKVMREDKRAELVGLLQEFAHSYPTTPQGQRHLVLYDTVRQQARHNFAEIVAAADRGEDTTDSVLCKLLPYTDSAVHQQKGVWV
jgi:hypothetical protein